MKFLKALKQPRILALLVCAVMLMAAVPYLGLLQSVEAAGSYTLSGSNFSLQLDQATGQVTNVTLKGSNYTSGTRGGFSIYDAANGANYNFSAPVTSKGNGVYTQSGSVGGNFSLSVTYTVKNGGIYVDATVSDSSGRDRKPVVEFAVPVKYNGMLWYYTGEAWEGVESGVEYSNTSNMVEGHAMDNYPWNVISNGSAAIAIGVPMDKPLSVKTVYDAVSGRQKLATRFSMGLSPSAKNRSKADFGFSVFAPDDPASRWAFRSAAQKYYDLYPEFFLYRGYKGNWLFQHDYYAMEGKEDYHFAYNETPGSYLKDAQNNVHALKYTAPCECFIEWVGAPQNDPGHDAMLNHLNALTQSSYVYPAGHENYGMTEGQYYTYVKNSVTKKSNGQYFFHSWRAWGEGWTATTNQDPDIPNGGFTVMLNKIKNAKAAAEAEGSFLGGVYIDNLSGGYSLNYSSDHIKYTDYPLLWAYSSAALAVPEMSTTVEYATRIYQDDLAAGMYTLGNTVFTASKAGVKYAHLSDLPGSEVGDGIGSEYGCSFSEQRYRRFLTYRKGWALLGTNPQDQPVDNYVKEKMFKTSMVYGLYFNAMGYRVDPVNWENCRYLFRRYTPIIDLADELGWVPTTYVEFGSSVNGVIERYGDFSKDAILVTAMNLNTSGTIRTGLKADLKKIGLDSSKWQYLMAFDLINNEMVEIDIDGNGILTIDRDLSAQEATGIIIGTLDAVWDHLGTRISSDLTRIAGGLRSVPKTIKQYREDLPSDWSNFSKKMTALTRYAGLPAEEILPEAEGMYEAVSDLYQDIANMYGKVGSGKNMYDIHVRMTADTIYMILMGLFDDPTMLPDTPPTTTTTRSTSRRTSTTTTTTTTKAPVTTTTTTTEAPVVTTTTTTEAPGPGPVVTTTTTTQAPVVTTTTTTTQAPVVTTTTTTTLAPVVTTTTTTTLAPVVTTTTTTQAPVVTTTTTKAPVVTTTTTKAPVVTTTTKAPVVTTTTKALVVTTTTKAPVVTTTKAPVVSTLAPSNKVSFEKGSENGVQVGVNADAEKITSVLVDGVVVPESKYSVEPGSVITISAEYLENLSVGQHTIAVKYVGGTANFALAVRSNIPNTGQAAPIFGGVALLAAGAALFLLKKKD